MKRTFLAPFFLTAIVFVTLFAQNVQACSCDGIPTPYQTYRKSTAVFVGKIISEVDETGKEILKKKSPESEEFPEPPRREGTVFYRFAVQEWFKGAKSPEITIAVSLNMCQGGLDIGSAKLVYANEWEGVLWTGTFCSRTKTLENDDVEVHFLSALLKNKAEPRIYGTVKLFEDKIWKPTYLEGIKVIAQSKKRKFSTLTDKNGIFSFHQIPNGNYKILPELPKKYALIDWYNIREITLHSKPWTDFNGLGNVMGNNVYVDIRVQPGNQN